MPVYISSNPVHGEVYSIQQYVIKFVSYLRHIKLTATISLKVVLYTINQTYSKPLYTLLLIYLNILIFQAFYKMTGFFQVFVKCLNLENACNIHVYIYIYIYLIVAGSRNMQFCARYCGLFWRVKSIITNVRYLPYLSY